MGHEAFSIELLLKLQNKKNYYQTTICRRYKALQSQIAFSTFLAA